MFKTFNLGLIQSRMRRLERIADSDRMSDAVCARRDATGGAQSYPELAFSGVSTSALAGIVQQGLCTGRALGRGAGANADNIWFKRGEPFYYDSPTLVISAARLLAMGGQDTRGLAGQSDVMTVHHDAAPCGIPMEEFAIVFALAGGWVVPVYKPSHWVGPAGAEVSFSDFGEW